jgi:hypothetical protein
MSDGLHVTAVIAVVGFGTVMLATTGLYLLDRLAALEDRRGDEAWLADLLHADEQLVPCWPGAGTEHLYPDCPAYARTAHPRDVHGNAPTEVVSRIDPDSPLVCGHCRRRREDRP